MSRLGWAIEALVIFTLAWLFFYFWQFSTVRVIGFDGYYHIKYAWLLRQHGIFQDFPWAQFSLWRDNFADKEFLFHVLLIPFTFFADLQVGAKHAAVFFAALFIANFSLVLRLQRVPVRYLWTVLLFVAGDVFLYRLHLPRPHLLSMILMLWLVYATVQQRYVLIAVLSAVYVHAYTALHMPVLLGIIFCAGQRLMGEKISWRSLYVPSLAVAVSSLVSPFFPNNLILFYVQNLKLIWQHVFTSIDLNQGTELLPTPTRYFLLYNTALLLPFVSALYLAVLHPRQISRESKHLLAMALFFLAMTMLSKRFVEYSYPIGMLFCACYYRDRWGSIAWRSLLAKAKLTTVALAVLILALLGANGIASYHNLHSDITAVKRLSYYKAAAQFLQQHTPVNTTVFTCDWDDAPELFFFNHHNRYMVFMDPTFMYSWSPEVWRAWHSITNGRAKQRTATAIYHGLGLQYGFCTQNFHNLRAVIDDDPHLRIIYEDKWTYVFQVTPLPPADDAAASD